MKRVLGCCALFLAAWVAVTEPLVAQDEKKEMKPEKKGDAAPVEKAPDWSKFAKMSEVTGEVWKADETTITIRNKVPQGRGAAKNVDVDYKWNDQGLARREKPPTFFDDKGLARKGKPEEVAKLKKPAGVPGYWMEKTELKPGDRVRLEMVRPTSISAAKAKPEDLTIKYAFLVMEAGGAQTPPKK